MAQVDLFSLTGPTDIKLNVMDSMRGRKRIKTVTVVDEIEKWAFSWDSFDDDLREEIKSLEGTHWCGNDKKNPRKVWTVVKSERNAFRLQYLQCIGAPGEVNPYSRWDRPLVDVDFSDRPYWEHQKSGVREILAFRRCLLAWEMGVGKSLTVLKAMEEAKKRWGWRDEEMWYVCKAGALFEIECGFEEWKSQVDPIYFSYEGMRDRVKVWPQARDAAGRLIQPPPHFLVLDESTAIKDPDSQRSIMARRLCNMMRREYGDDCIIVDMSGAPAPKDPGDWWHQCEVLQPGFVREGDWTKFRRNLAVVELKEGWQGSLFNKVVAWKDDEAKCNKCGEFAHAAVHSESRILQKTGHKWVASENKVKQLYGRLKGMVTVKFKRDCIQLPKRVRRVHRCKPSQQMLNAMKLIVAKANSAVQALVLMRELSDGFQYQDFVGDWKKCPTCGGGGVALQFVDADNPTEPASDEAIEAGRVTQVEGSCDECAGGGEVPITKRGIQEVACPKDEVLADLLDEHMDIGRLVTYAGFTGSVDRCVKVHHQRGWNVVRVDGRGWHVLPHQQNKWAMPQNGREAYKAFRRPDEWTFPLAIVAQASTAAHGLNFDVTPTEVFYSNDFNFENRIQADERNMRGKIMQTLEKHRREHVLIVDICHLDSDLLVLANHKAKRKMQSLTMGDLKTALAGLQPHEVAEST